MKYSITILALLLFAGISMAANVTVYNDFYPTADTNYNWTLTKTADKSELVFQPAPDPNPQTVLFTVTITRTGPVFLTQKHGTINITNNDLVNPVTITRVLDSLVYLQNGLPPGVFVAETLLFLGSHTIAAGQTWQIPYVFTFTTPYPIGPFAFHYNYTNVLTDSNQFFQDVDPFHVDFPGVVNETLHVWDEYTVPSGFNAVPTWNPAYSGSYWTTVAGNATLLLSLSITNQSAPVGSFVLKNKGSGINECGLWEDSVLITLRDTTPPDTFPPDTGFGGHCFTPGYWKNHPSAYDQWLPITFCGITVNTTSQGFTILSRSGQSQSPWYKFLCHYFALILNTLYDPGLLNCYYNDTSKTGEFMEGQTVAYIVNLANTYTSSTPSATLLAMKDVCDKINNSTETSFNVLWTTPEGGSGSTVSLSKSTVFTLNPNPFTNGTEIRLSTNVKEPVTLSVYNIGGAKVRDLVTNGNSTLYWDGTDNNGRKLNSGVYIIRYENKAQSMSLKVLINR